MRLRSAFIWLAFLFFVLEARGSVSGSDPLDSLLTQLSVEKQDSVKLRLLAALSELCEENEILTYAMPALDLADKLLLSVTTGKANILKYKADALNNIGFVHMNHGNNRGALDNFTKSLNLRKEIKDQVGIASSLNNIASIYRLLGNIDLALENYERALKIQEEINDKQGISISLNNLGVLWLNKNDYSKALTYYQRGLELQEELGNK